MADAVSGSHGSGSPGVNQAGLNLACYGACPVMEFYLDVCIGELAEVNRMLVLGSATADLHLSLRADPPQAPGSLPVKSLTTRGNRP